MDTRSSDALQWLDTMVGHQVSILNDGHQGWGWLSQFVLFYFPNFSVLLKHTLAIEYHVYIWRVSPQLNYGDTCQIWMWFKEYNRYFCKIENFAYGEINERSFNSPHPKVTYPTAPQYLIRVKSWIIKILVSLSRVFSWGFPYSNNAPKTIPSICEFQPKF